MSLSRSVARRGDCSVHPEPGLDPAYDAWDRALRALPFGWTLAPCASLGVKGNVVIAFATENRPWPERGRRGQSRWSRPPRASLRQRRGQGRRADPDYVARRPKPVASRLQSGSSSGGSGGSASDDSLNAVISPRSPTCDPCRWSCAPHERLMLRIVGVGCVGLRGLRSRLVK